MLFPPPGAMEQREAHKRPLPQPGKKKAAEHDRVLAWWGRVGWQQVAKFLINIVEIQSDLCI